MEYPTTELFKTPNPSIPVAVAVTLAGATVTLGTVKYPDPTLVTLYPTTWPT